MSLWVYDIGLAGSAGFGLVYEILNILFYKFFVVPLQLCQSLMYSGGFFEMESLSNSYGYRELQILPSTSTSTSTS